MNCKEAVAKSIRTICASTVMFLLASAGTASATSYIVELKPDATISSVTSAYGITTLQSYKYALNGFAADLSTAVYKKVRADSRVASVTADETVTVVGLKAKSVTIGSQLVSTGITRIGGLASPTAKIDGVSDPMNVDIAIVDSGIDLSHPDLNVVGGIDCTKNSKVGYADEFGHGTEVAGFAAAIDNHIGVVGAAPGARLWSVRTLSKSGMGTKSATLCGIDWLASMSGTIEVANLSFGGKGSDDGNCGLTKKDPLHQAICKASANGITIIASAGNESDDSAAHTPGAYDEVITVSALADTDGQPGGTGGIDSCTGFADDVFAPFSNFGADVDISAPGTCLSTTALGGGYIGGSGTSFSAPLVAGGAALYLTNHPYTSPAGVRAALISVAEAGPVPGDPDAFAEPVLNVGTL